MSEPVRPTLAGGRPGHDFADAETAQMFRWIGGQLVARAMREGVPTPELFLRGLDALGWAASASELGVSAERHEPCSSSPAPSGWCETRDVARALGISRRHAERLAPGLPGATRVGRMWLLPLTEVARLKADRDAS